MLMRASQAADLQWLLKSKDSSGRGREQLRKQQRTVFSYTDKAGIKDGVEVWSEKQAIKNIESLGVTLAVSPGLNVARA